MASVAAVLETQRSLESLLMKKMADLETQLKSSSCDPNSDKVLQIQDEFHNFKDVVHNILNLLRQQINEVIKSVDVIETRHRQKCLLLSGVPEYADSDLTKDVSTLLQKHLGIADFTEENIKSCYRLGRPCEGRSRPTIIQFSTSSIRSLVWKSKTKLRGSSLVIHEFLTKNRQAAFRGAREYFGMRNVWTSNGYIYILAPNGERVRIVSSDELDNITAKFPKPSSVTAAVVTVENSQISKTVQTRPKRVHRNAK